MHNRFSHFAPSSFSSLLAAILLLALVICERVAHTPAIRVLTVDDANRPVGAVRLELRRGGALVGSVVTNEKGEAEFPLTTPARYEITAAKEEFETLTQYDLTIVAGAPLEVRFIMVPK